MITIDISEFDFIKKNISTLAQDLADEIDGELASAAKDYARLAKQSLATSLSANNNKKTGRLLGSINYAPIGRLSYEAFAQTDYAAYNEWGTITHVSVPPDLVDIAIKYKGRGIRTTGGMRAKHFFYPHRAIVIPQLLNNLRNVVEDRLGR